MEVPIYIGKTKLNGRGLGKISAKLRNIKITHQCKISEVLVFSSIRKMEGL